MGANITSHVHVGFTATTARVHVAPIEDNASKSNKVKSPRADQVVQLTKAINRGNFMKCWLLARRNNWHDWTTLLSESAGLSVRSPGTDDVSEAEQRLQVLQYELNQWIVNKKPATSKSHDHLFYKFLLKPLLRKGFNPTILDKTGYTALHAALIRPAYLQQYTSNYDSPYIQNHEIYTIKLVKLLCQYGADVNQATPGSECTPLHLAARFNMRICVKILMKHGAQIDWIDNEGKSALMWASQEGSIETLSYVLSYGPDVTIQSVTGKTALHLAAEQDFAFSSHLLIKLLRAGVDPNIQDHNGDTTLHILARKRAPKRTLVQLLLYDANPAIPNNDGNTPFDDFLANNDSGNHDAIYAFIECLPNVKTANKYWLSKVENDPDAIILYDLTVPESLQRMCVRKIRGCVGVRNLVYERNLVAELELTRPCQELVCDEEFQTIMTRS